MKNHHIKSIAFVVFALSLFSCSKPDQSADSQEKLRDKTESKNYQTLITGSWLYNESECAGDFNRETFFEIQIGDTLNSSSLNVIDTRSLDFSTSIIDIEHTPALYAQIQHFFKNCENYAQPKEKVLRITYKTNETNWDLALFPNSRIMLPIEPNLSGIFVTPKRVREIIQ